MKMKILSMMTVIGLATFLPSANAAVKIGELAPNFTAVDTKGIEHSLSDFKGKNVVLEWSNHDCPFVRKHYEPGNMQKTQKEATDNGAIWITIVSSATGKQGAINAEESNKVIEEVGAHSTARILDPSGEIGKLYGAKTTPHMFVIDKQGNLAYMGAIDSDSSFKSEAIKHATNYVSAALTSLNAGEEVKVASTKPYGCSVKY
jgi:peroxiredoxin